MIIASSIVKEFGIFSEVGASEFQDNAIGKSIFILFFFIISFVPFLGEEYGWRYFLQPALQERIGARKGVIILGLIRGIWHLPLNFTLYNPETPFLSIINQLSVCICFSVFWGFVYMKTKNIWSVVAIHYVNNSFIILSKGEIYNQLYNIKIVVLIVIASIIVFMPSLFSKVYTEYNKNITDGKN